MKKTFMQPCVCTTLKSMCMSVCGVTLWNSLDEEIKQSSSTIQFKNRYTTPHIHSTTHSNSLLQAVATGSIEQG